MATALTTAPKHGHPTFLFSQLATDLDALQADIAFLGIPYGSAYSVGEISNDQSTMPTAMRQASDRMIRSLERYDFDLGGPLYAGKPIWTVDCGDVRADIADPKAHVARAEQAVRKILAAGAMPIVLGGDHAVPIPVLRAFEGRGPITLIQIDQHIDWRDEVNGVRDGLSSPIRRASEMEHIGEIFQIGLRATGSARQEEVDAANAYGAHLISAYELHEAGMDAILDAHPGRRPLLPHRRHGRHGLRHRAGRGGADARRGYVCAGAAADPRPGGEGPRGRHGRGRDHPAHRRQSDHLHHRRPPDRQSDRHGRARRLLRLNRVFLPTSTVRCLPRPLCLGTWMIVDGRVCQKLTRVPQQIVSRDCNTLRSDTRP